MGGCVELKKHRLESLCYRQNHGSAVICGWSCIGYAQRQMIYPYPKLRLDYRACFFLPAIINCTDDHVGGNGVVGLLFGQGEAAAGN
jgi:hypothetical protein